MAKTKTSTLPAAVFARVPPPRMLAARVVKYDARRGSGQVVLKSSGRKVRIPWSTLKNANVIALSPGDVVYIALDEIDEGRAETIWVGD